MNINFDALLTHAWLGALYLGTGSLAFLVVGLVLAVIGMVLA